MKKTFLNSLLFFLLLIASCKKDTNEFVPDPGQQLDSAWTNNVTANSQVLILSKNLEGSLTAQNINTATDTTISSASGLQISFPTNGLLLNGTALNGTVKVEYVLLQKKGDFIRYGVPTSTNKYPLESGGALHIRLTSNSQPITVASSRKIIIRYRDAEPKQGMSIFYGNTPVVTNSLLFDWTLATDNSFVKVWDSTNTYPAAKGYAVETYRTGWVNVDRSIPSSQPRVEIKAVLPDLFSNANSAVYIVFKNYRSVVQLSGNPTLRHFSFPNIPVNEPVIFVSVSKVGSSYYLGVKEEKTAANMVSFVKPTLSSLAAINALLNSL
ncbi:MAG: hypothetical protein IPK31_18280 [Chitinophagaceae bacterium]|nr:hypothetical protein [Chitinophagaceae bacterium]